jgi:hypothetical protein
MIKKSKMFYTEKTKRQKRRKSLPQKLFAISKPIHKYAGLALGIFLIWMSLSGILLNHPGLIADISVPKWLVPGHYHLENWNRSSLVDADYFADNPSEIYIGGRQGVWLSENYGKSFRPMMDGAFPESRYLRKTRDILAYKINRKQILFAATAGGLFAYQEGSWQRMITDDEREDFRKIINTGKELLAFTKNRIYKSQLDEIKFERLKTSRSEKENKMTLVEFFFELHGGGAWGLPGKIIYDITGIAVIFLSLSALYIWVFPKRWKPEFLQKPHLRRLFKYLFKYHLKIGIIFAVILLLIAATGLFMRPPLIVALLDGSVPKKYYPGIRHESPWHRKIRNAMHDKRNNKIIIDATDGYWTAPDDFSQPFDKEAPPVAIFPMGATVFNVDKNGDYLIGSFLGLFRIDHDNGEINDVINGDEVKIENAARPGDNMVTGYFCLPDGEYVNTHYQGLKKLDGDNTKFIMPELMKKDYRMPLWNYMFELHNGRIFKGFIGGWYILFVPVGALLFLFISFTGVFDWAFIKLKGRAARKRGSPGK